MKSRYKLLFLVLALALLLPIFSQAAILDNDLIKEAECSGSGCTLNTFVSLGVSVANYILGIVGALTLLMFVYGGLMWILSGGSSDKVQKGKDIIIGSVVGLVIVFSSYLIVSFVSKNLLGVEFTGKAPEDKTSTTTNNTSVCQGECKNACNPTLEIASETNDCKKDGKKCCSINPQGDCNGECVVKGRYEVSCTIGTGTCGNGGVCCQAGTLQACSSYGNGYSCLDYSPSTCSETGSCLVKPVLYCPGNSICCNCSD